MKIALIKLKLCYHTLHVLWWSIHGPWRKELLDLGCIKNQQICALVFGILKTLNVNI